jgi:octaprenyl-diphosphate synthase
MQLRAKSDSKKFEQYLLETRQLIDFELLNITKNLTKLQIFPQLKYVLATQGKRLRPIMLILCAQSVGEKREKVTALAVAIELLHISTLIHDDVIDKEKMRRGILCLHEKWTPSDAILVGDALIALAITFAADFGSKVMKIVAHHGLELCNGQYMDISSSLENTTEKDYFLKIKQKSASLFKAAAHCGAVAGGGTSSETECLAKFGEFYGIAYQLRDDMEDLKHGVISRDLMNGVVTLPFIYLYQNGDTAAIRLLKENFGNKDISRENFEKLLLKMDEAKAVEYCKQKTLEYVNAARINLANIPESEFKHYLLSMCDLIINS